MVREKTILGIGSVVVNLENIYGERIGTRVYQGEKATESLENCDEDGKIGYESYSKMERLLGVKRAYISEINLTNGFDGNPKNLWFGFSFDEWKRLGKPNRVEIDRLLSYRFKSIQ